MEYDLGRIEEENSDLREGMRAEIIYDLGSVLDKVSRDTKESLESVLRSLKNDY
jgi:hypothetical protein